MEECKKNLICYYYTVKLLSLKEIQNKLHIHNRTLKRILHDNNIKICKDNTLEDRLKLGFHLYHRLHSSLFESAQKSKVSINALKDYCKNKKVNIRHSSYNQLSSENKKIFNQLWEDVRVYSKKREFIIPKHLNNIICDRMGDMILKYFEQGISPTKMRQNNLIPVGHSAIVQFLNNNNISLKPNGSYTIFHSHDEHYFEYIDSEDKAYWLGFIMGDGSVTKCKSIDSGSLTIALKESDCEHLELFKQHIKTTATISHYKIKSKYNGCSLTISNRKIFNDLNQYGVIPNKTYKLRFPKQINEKYYSHIIRGIFDADGSIPYNKNIPSGVDICGTIELMKDIAYIIDIDTKYIYVRHDLHNFANIRCNKKQEALRILKYIYEDANIYLNRKYQRYLKFKELYE